VLAAVGVRSERVEDYGQGWGQKGGPMTCPVCASPAERVPGTGDFARYICLRCGEFILNGSAEATIGGFLSGKPTRRSLMSHTIRRMQVTSHPPPRISDTDLPSYWAAERLPPPQQRADNLIIWCGDNQEGPAWQAGTTVAEISAWIGTEISSYPGREGLDWLNAQLKTESLYEWWDPAPDEFHMRLTMPGWQRYHQLKKRDVDSRAAFMAMKFGDPLLNKAVDECFRPAVDRTGFLLRLLTDNQCAGLIDDQLLAAMLASRFIIADLSHGNQGAYWEAGFGEGLGLPVIYTCETTKWAESKTHFDTNHMVTIIWDPADLQKAQNLLTATIRATLRGEAKQSD
jgi:hypothetical protein